MFSGLPFGIVSVWNLLLRGVYLNLLGSESPDKSSSERLLCTSLTCLSLFLVGSQPLSLGALLFLGFGTDECDDTKSEALSRSPSSARTLLLRAMRASLACSYSFSILIMALSVRCSNKTPHSCFGSPCDMGQSQAGLLPYTAAYLKSVRECTADVKRRRDRRGCDAA